MARDYKHEYKKFQSSTVQKKRRANRNKHRRRALKSGLVKKGDSKHCAHVGVDKTVIKEGSVNMGSKTDMPGDVKARGGGSKKFGGGYKSKKYGK